MNSVTRDIMKAADCDQEKARKIHMYLMGHIYLDFSECTQKEYEAAVKQAIAEYK